MFDLRYHVVSLAAVFLALVLGVLLGVGISETGRVDDVERDSYEARIRNLERDLQAAAEQDVDAERQRKAADTIVAETYPILMEDRLAGDAGRDRVRRLGRREQRDPRPACAGCSRTAARAGRFASASSRCRSTPTRSRPSSTSRSELARFSGPDRYDELGAELAQELVAGDDTPLWDALSPLLVGEEGGHRHPAAGRDRRRAHRRAPAGRDRCAPRRLLRRARERTVPGGRCRDGREPIRPPFRSTSG